MRLVVLAVLLATTTSCQAEHECQNPKEIKEDYTPIFDIGTENWSFQDCGVWSNREVAAPWRVAVSRTDGATCFGIFLSNYDFVTSECKEVADDFRKEPSGVKAYTGTCYDQKVKSTDAPSANCTGLEVKGVAALGKDSDETQLHLWRLKVAAPDTTPICLFNANQKQKGGYGVTDDYQVFDRKWKGHVAAKVGGAPKSSQTSALCVKIGSRQSHNADKHDFSGDFLLKEVGGRMSLRGFFFWPVAEHKIFVYTDVVPFIKELVTNSHNMYIMPQVPPPKTKTDFSKAPKLNNKTICGKVVGNTEAKKRLRKQRDTADVNIPIDHIVRGTKSKMGAYPWHASLSYRPKNEDNSDYEICGATLISDRVVVTAAHCVFNEGNQFNTSDLQIALGMYHTTEINGTEQYIRAESIVVHPEYNPNKKMYDVALLFLKEKANVTDHVRPICLWDDDYSIDIIKGKFGTVVGWGTTDIEQTDNNTRQKSDVLLEGRLSVVDHKDCYVQEKVFYRKFLHPGLNFCASGVTGAQNQSVAACNGDSGGSFVIEQEGTWYLRGVVSFGVSKKIKNDKTEYTCNEKYPSLYVDLASCMEWIVQEVAKYVPLSQ